MKTNNLLCGLTFWHPLWLQKFANSKSFLFIYGFLGLVQGMASLYFIITLTTLEKRFKIPSQTTGIIISGNEISQILLSLILSYTGGQRNRPRWIFIGVLFCSISCFILALPHFLYGPGEDALRLTKEYNSTENIDLSFINSTAAINHKAINRLCLATPIEESCDEILSIVPLVVIFFSQFILGIGNTLYYTLGQSYLDDNTKRSKTPMLLAVSLSMRMLGPVIGFVFSAFILRIYIDPTKTPLIDREDPRWLGAWWLGWIIMGALMMIFAVLISLFPKELKKAKINIISDEGPYGEETVPFQLVNTKKEELVILGSVTEIPKLKDFSVALKRLLTNKILMCNIISTVFYILGASGYITFVVKYMEVQFNRSATDSTVITGPVIIFGMLSGFLVSGYIISKYKPNVSFLLLWNVFVGFLFIIGQFSFLFLTCYNDDNLTIINPKLNLTTECNMNCACDSVPYTPCCDVNSKTTFYSPCHAGCNSWHSDNRTYSDCQCTNYNENWHIELEKNVSVLDSDNGFEYKIKTNTTMMWENSTIIIKSLNDIDNENQRIRRNIIKNNNEQYLIPGPCNLEGCTTSFYLFVMVFFIVNFLGASGKVTNILLNFRCVAKHDKSFSQGLVLMLISLFALIPGPILYGRIIDDSCLVWNTRCMNTKGNCQLYDQKLFRYYINIFAMGLTTVAVFFDGLVWHFGKHVNIYAEDLRSVLQK